MGGVSEDRSGSGLRGQKWEGSQRTEVGVVLEDRSGRGLRGQKWEGS